jgi:hypothetical protein
MIQPTVKYSYVCPVTIDGVWIDNLIYKSHNS